MIDYHALRSNLKQRLLMRWQEFDIADDPLAWAWIVRAFASEGAANNPPLAQALDLGRRWLEEDTVWQNDAYLGGIGLLYGLLGRPGDDYWTVRLALFAHQVQRLSNRDIGKFSPLNNPDVVFGLAHIAYRAPPPALSGWLRDHCVRQSGASAIRRAVLFAAAASELGGAGARLGFDVNDLAVHELIPAIWLAERYSHLVDGIDRRRGVWEAYERLKDSISLDEIGTIDLAMFYEAVVQKTVEADFVALFNNMPLHQSVHSAAASLFLKGEYVSAVFEAAKAFIEAVKHRAGNPHDSSGKPLDGVPLMTYTFGGKPPRLKFTSLSNQPEQNEHRGLALIAEGVVSALRNPKGHLPGTAITLIPQEALEQLATISYLMRRLGSAKP